MSIIHEALKKTQDHLKGMKSQPVVTSGTDRGSGPSSNPPLENTGPAAPASPLVSGPAALEGIGNVPGVVDLNSSGSVSHKNLIETVLRFLTPAQPRQRIFLLSGVLVIIALIGSIVLITRVFTRSLHDPAAEGPKIVVQGIMTHGDRQVVLINGDIYEIGEKVAGMRIVGISLESVQMLKDGRIKTLRVVKEKASSSEPRTSP